ncbi:WD repeat-containing protein 25 [Mixophyes fleayi]|uniref:WD repeat-containing protein 25 n=1 Tax=Mixophyes fleayi TaxID=3061075 RepID=UPI003F4DB23A
MNSLVAYDDSETDDLEDGGIPPTSLAAKISTMPLVPSRLQTDFNRRPSGMDRLTESPFGKDLNATESESKYRVHNNVMARNMSVSESKLEKPVQQDGQKRPPSDENVVKPYIPKRLRQEQSNMAEEVDCNISGRSHEHTRHQSWDIYRVSEYLGPHLHLKYRNTELPQKVIFQMREHTGPVNRIQWCPVKQSSHLLLSASMDATFKVWDAVDSGKCLRAFSCHRAAVRDAQWSACGRKILTGGFDSFLYLTDVESGKHLFSAKNECKISAVRFNPSDPNIFICGGFSPVISAWDVRTDKVIRQYKAAVQQHFDFLFLPGGNEFVSTTDSVSRDSADRTIIAWDFATAAKISNQIFHERYTCPSLALHPKDRVFVAQTNGNYIALFSTQRPYTMNKKKRFEGHKVEGFSVGCEFSPDGSLIVTGSSEGSVFFYSYHTAKIIRSVPGDGSACVSVNYHSVLTSLLAASYWDGQIRIWQ